MFRVVRNGKIPTLKLDQVIEKMQLEKPIMPTASLKPKWFEDAGVWLRFVQNMSLEKEST